MQHTGIRALTGLASVAVIAAIVAVAVGLFQGSFTESVPVTVLASRAGLVMNTDAKVKMRGVQVGKVDSIEARPNGQAVLHLAMYPSEMHLIPANVLVDLTSPTVFGAKFVDLVAPAEPSAQSLHAGQVLDSQHVTVEINTVFKQLTAVLGKLDPAKLNETLGAVSQALSGRGEKLGQAFSDLDSFLAKFNPSIPALSRDIALSVPVFRAYGDASPDLVRTVNNSVKISQSIVDEQHNLDAFLVSAIGLADVGNDVLGTNRKGLTDVLRLLAPTTDLLNEYAPALTCTLGGLAQIQKSPPLPEPSINIAASLTWGGERYRYPQNLPKVAATGGPRCMSMPKLPFNTKAKLLVADTGANPVGYGNPQLLLNFDGLKQLLYGPIDGPPRNPAQVGQQG
ncbi:MAG TPA: MCE family protein [Mycobacterium sp.]|nr:MCE family protein [Mycobacterium sp.]